MPIQNAKDGQTAELNKAGTYSLEVMKIGSALARGGVSLHSRIHSDIKISRPRDVGKWFEEAFIDV